MGLSALRNLDIFPVEQDGQMMICLRDPEGYVDEHVLLSPHAFFVAACLDGQNDVVDIQQAFAQQFRGALLMGDDIMRVVRYLEERGFLHSERFANLRRDIDEAFFSGPGRPPWLAGKSYPDDPDETRTYLDGLFESVAAAALPHGGPPTGCLVVPHIDFDRGGEGYAKGYAILRQTPPPEAVIIFGVAHQGCPAPFALTRKHYDTPLGRVETDLELVDRLAAACPDFDPFESEILHRTEHSVEFHALLLAHIFGPETRIVPILCGGMFEMGASGPVRPTAGTLTFLETSRDIVREGAGRVAVIAAADLSHIGRRFGDDFDITPEIAARMERQDRESLRHVCEANAEAFHESVMRDGNQRRICGHGCIYAALKSTEGSVRPGEMFHYAYAPDPSGGVVSFASIGFPFS